MALCRLPCRHGKTAQNGSPQGNAEEVDLEPTDGDRLALREKEVVAGGGQHADEDTGLVKGKDPAVVVVGRAGLVCREEHSIVMDGDVDAPNKAEDVRPDVDGLVVR